MYSGCVKEFRKYNWSWLLLSFRKILFCDACQIVKNLWLQFNKDYPLRILKYCGNTQYLPTLCHFKGKN